MSFYGNVVYEFTKMFSKLLVTKNNLSENPILPSEEENEAIFFEATDMWEQVNLNPSNRWIQLNGIGGNSVQKTITIGHSSAGVKVDEKASHSFVRLDAEPEANYTLLKSGDYLQTCVTNFDAAGHFIDNDENNNLTNPYFEYYKLPVPTIRLSEEAIVVPNENDELLFIGDNSWILLNRTEDGALYFSHTKLYKEELDLDSYNELLTFCGLYPYPSEQHITSKEKFLEIMAVDERTEVDIERMTEVLNNENIIISEENPVIPLESGDLIQIYQITTDLNGHIIEYSPKYFKLPISPTQLNFDGHNNRITKLENLLSTYPPEDNADWNKGRTYEEHIDYMYNISDLFVMSMGNFEDVFYLYGDYTGYPDDIHNLSTIIGPITGSDAENDPSKVDSIYSALSLLGTPERKISDDDTRSWYNISEAIQILSKSFYSQSADIGLITNWTKGVDTTLDSLKLRVAALEAYHKGGTIV